MLSLQAHEHRRFSKATLRRPPQPWTTPPRVLVCVPCKGVDLELEENLRHVLAQSYSNFQVRFVVEDSADPAYPLIRRLISETKIPCELVIAGKCTDSGQKVHNLLRVTSELPPEIDALVFFDSDARPPLDAVERFVDRICRGKLQVATGYRWFVPKRPTWANLTLASINAAVASLLNNQGRNLLWGGGWAVTRDVFDKIALADAWRGTLSDDLVASSVIRNAGIKLAFEPGCMSATALDVNWRGAISFLRRQLIIGRCYAPRWWWTTLPWMILQPTVLVGGIVLAAWLAWRGESYWFAPPIASLSLYAMACLRARWRQDAWCKQVEASQVALDSAARFDYWAAPWTCLFAATVMLASLVGRAISWRGIRYHIGAAGRITLLGRVPSNQELAELLHVQASQSSHERAMQRQRLAAKANAQVSEPIPHEAAHSADQSTATKRAA